MPTHYPYLLDPTAYPDFSRREFPVPTWETFENTTQFATLRDLSQSSWREDLIAYTEEFNLGRVIWPMIHVLYSQHIGEVIQEIRDRRLYFFDLWSIVPGSPMEGPWSNITPPAGMVEYLRRELGDRFLGIDNGEQDGRYVWATGEQQCPSPSQRFRQYLMFQRHFQKLTDELGNQMSALVSLCFGHYFLKEQNHMLLGAETAQALPCSQIYYAFIRGACKQYGVLWFGNASCFNRWGWKDYGPERHEGRLSSGPERGTSLNLLKRLMYTHYLYNSVSVGFEMGWLLPAEDEKTGESGSRYKLTPIGTIQKGGVDFVARHGLPGVMHTPVAVLLDFFAGWAPPRHLYTKNVCQVWGGMPYEMSDYLTHGVLSLLYPGYEDASYYHDERGFLTPTPYGDMADCILSDVPEAVLGQYGLVIAAGELGMTPELREKLSAFVEDGGSLFVTGVNARRLFPELSISENADRYPPGTEIVWTDGHRNSCVEAFGFELNNIDPPGDARILARCGNSPAIVEIPWGRGAITISLSVYGLCTDSLLPPGPIDNPEDGPLPCLYRLLDHVEKQMETMVQAQRLFSVGEDLGYVTCRKGEGGYTIGIYNSSLTSKEFSIISHCGEIESIKELELDQSEKGAVGQWPEGYSGESSGDDSHIAGGDIRLFAVRVGNEDVTCRSKSTFASYTHNKFVIIPKGFRVQEAILASPTFFHNYDGVIVPHTYLAASDKSQLERERGWLCRQSVRLVVDFSEGLNFYPDITLLSAYPPHYEAGRKMVDDVFGKMASLGAENAVITLHRKPENHWDVDRSYDEFTRNVRDLCRRAASHGITVHLQAHPKRWVYSTPDAVTFIRGVGEKNLKVAVNTGHIQWMGESLTEAIAAAGDLLGAVLICSGRKDQFDQWYDAHLPAHEGKLDLQGLGETAGTDDILFLLIGDYASIDDAYPDLTLVRSAQGEKD